ncbi:MAG: hypothetical protein WCJ49_04385 [Deltaproteobacteria bacterium]
MNFKYIIIIHYFIMMALQSWNVFSQTLDSAKNDALSISYNSCIVGAEEKLKGDNIKLVRARKLCTCYSEEMVGTKSYEKIKNISEGRENVLEEDIGRLAEYCTLNFQNYNEYPQIKESLLNINTNSSYIFSGKPQRFTAYKEEEIGKDMVVMNTVEYQNGSYLYDIEIDIKKQINYLSELNTGKRYKLTQLSEMTEWAKGKGYDFTFFIPELNGFLLINSINNTFATALSNKNNNTVRYRHYVRSQALICTALKEIKSRMLRQSVASIFKEILLVAIKSYAGASYSGGTFTAYIPSGKTVNGIYTKYDNSWLGEHYSRGLDSIFSGAANINQVNSEIDRLECQYFK